MQLEQELLARLSEALAVAIGIHFEVDRLPFLEKALMLAGAEMGYNDAAQARELAEKVCRQAAVPEELQSLARHLTVGETYFFRDPRVFAELKIVLAELLAMQWPKDRVFRIWSAGCCTGEEAYSLAMLITTLLSHDGKFGPLSNWQIEIYASDINRDFLKTAEAGVYSAWSFRGAQGDDEIKAKFFTALTDGSFIINASIKKMVTFSYLNLADDYAYLDVLSSEPLNLVLCRNVLIYFATSVAGAVLSRLSASLAVEDGFLLLAPSDLPAAGTISHLRQSTKTFLPLFQRVALAETIDKASNRPQLEAEKYELEYARKLLRQGEYQSCERVINKALKSLSIGDRRRLDNSLHQQFLELKINLLISCARLDEACHQASLLVALEDRYQYLYLYAVVLQENGELLRAEELLLQVLHTKADFCAALLMYSSLLGQRGEKKYAGEQLIKLHSILLKLPADELLECTGDLSVKELLSTVDNLLGEVDA